MHDSIAVRNSATGIDLPVAILVIESSWIADRRRISVRRIDSESKSWAVVSPATGIRACPIKLPAATIESAGWRGEGAAAAKVSAARRSKGVPAATSSCMAATTSRKRRYRTERHRNHESAGSEDFSNQVQKFFFHHDLQRSSKRHADGLSQALESIDERGRQEVEKHHQGQKEPPTSARPGSGRRRGRPPPPQARPYLQVKFAASFGSPVPLYCAVCGYGHNGRVRSTFPSVR